jgi:putative heme-binding domain-containing protein
VGQLKLSSLTDEIVQAAESKNHNLTTRLAAMEALALLDAERAIAPLVAVLTDATAPTAAREQAVQQLGRINRPDARTAMLSTLKTAPESVAILIATAVAGTHESAAALFKEIGEGRASAALLREPTVVDRLRSSGIEDVDKQIDELTADLSPTDNRVATLIAQRRTTFLAQKHDLEAGRDVFAKSVCANCHRIGDVGQTIGPSLDGIGNRGLDRLLEDTLDPNRNVDVAFRTEFIETDSGQILSGFGFREDGRSLVFHDAQGEQVRVPMANVVERSRSTVSPMPANIIEQMPERDFNALMAYLLSLKNK